MGKLLVKLLDPRAQAPKAAHPGEDLCWDLYALEDVTFFPLTPKAVHTGISAVFLSDPGPKNPWPSEVPPVFGLKINGRSGLSKYGIHVLAGEIDAGYRGELIVMLVQLAAHPDLGTLTIRAGERVAQIRPVKVHTASPVEVVTELPDAKRGDAGFGSTGR